MTGIGVEAVVEGCHKLELFDVSQCKNLQRWLEGGGVARARKVWKRNVKFEVVAGDIIGQGKSLGMGSFGTSATWGGGAAAAAARVSSGGVGAAGAGAPAGAGWSATAVAGGGRGGWRSFTF